MTVKMLPDKSILGCKINLMIIHHYKYKRKYVPCVERYYELTYARARNWYEFSILQIEKGDVWR